MKKIRVGIFGAGRGMDLAKNLMMLDCDIVAICDSYEERREKALKIERNKRIKEQNLFAQQYRKNYY